MRALLLTARLTDPLGGAELYMIRLARSLSQRGLDVGVATLEIGDQAAEDLDDIQVFPLKAWNVYRPGQGKRPALPLRILWHLIDVYNPSVLPSMKRAVAHHAPDVVHTHNFQGLSPVVFSALRDVGHVHTVHDFGLIDPRNTLLTARGRVRGSMPLPWRLRMRVTSSSMERALLVFPSQRVLDIHVSMGWKVDRKRMEVLPHGWVAPGSAAGPPPTEPSDGTVRFLYLGRLLETKGLRMLLDAWGESGVSGAELWIAGDGPLRRDVEAAAGSSRALRYLGWLRDAEKGRALREADALVFPSLWFEIFPLVTAEALLMGVPLVATRLAHPPLLREDFNGVLVGESPAALRDGLSALARDRSRLETLRAGARATSAELDWDLHVDRVLGIYERAISLRHHPRT